MVQSACQYVKAYRFGRASKISGKLEKQVKKSQLFVILVTLVTNFGLFGVGKRNEIHGQIKQVTRPAPPTLLCPFPPTQNGILKAVFCHFFGQGPYVHTSVPPQASQASNSH